MAYLQNVMAKHRTGFTKQDWHTFVTFFSGVMRAGTEDELQEKLVQIQTEWVGTQLRAVQYVLSWMQYKTYFVSAYVDKVPHFESSSSSRVEGAHSALKQRLQVSTGDMMTVVERVLQFLTDQYQEIDTTISQQKEQRNPIHSNMFYDQVCKASYFHLIKSYVVD
jgi:hypothetical protein